MQWTIKGNIPNDKAQLAKTRLLASRPIPQELVMEDGVLVKDDDGNVIAEDKYGFSRHISEIVWEYLKSIMRDGQGRLDAKASEEIEVDIE